MTEDDDLDRTYEALTIEPHFVASTMPPEYIRGQIWPCWWGRPTNKQDIAYYNSIGQLHRIYGPAYINKVYGYEMWYKHGDLHRVDGPAVILKRGEMWFTDGKLHRIGGPAVSGDGRPKEFWINGQQLPPKEYKKEIARRLRKGSK
jgi:hypothetical protein